VLEVLRRTQKGAKRRLVSKRRDESRGSMLPLPLQFLAAWLAVWLGRVLQQEVDYLMAENRILREKLGGRVRLTDADRRRLAVLGKKMGRKALAKVATILKGAGVKAVRLPAMSPNLNAYAERFVLSIEDGSAGCSISITGRPPPGSGSNNGTGRRALRRRPRAGAHIETPGGQVGRQQCFGCSGENQRLKYKRRQGVVRTRATGGAAVVPGVAPVHIDRPLAAHHGLNPGGLRQPGPFQ
jgi:hypothetical protein